MKKKADRGFKGYPVATVALYGPTAELATKMVVSIVKDEGEDPDPLERWFSEGKDIRRDAVVGLKVEAFLRRHPVRSVIAADRIIGCPHEEGIDYPLGEWCPQCPFWAGRDRFTHELIE